MGIMEFVIIGIVELIKYLISERKINMKKNNVKIDWKNVDEKSIKMNSPFSVYPGEFMERNRPTFPRRIDLNRLQVEIILAVEKFLVLTSRLITTYLNNKGFVCDQKTVQKEILCLSENSYLNKYTIRSSKESSRASYKVYTIGRKGIGFIFYTYNRYVEKVNYIEKCTVSQIKKILSSNQVLIEMNFMNKSEVYVAKMVVDEGFHLIGNNNLFRASGRVEDEKNILIIEPVRNEADFDITLIHKLKRIKKTLLSKKCNIDTTKKITILIVAESIMMMQQLINIVDENDYVNVNIKYSYDTLFVNETKNKFYKKSKDLKRAECLIAI